jgi:hypothetical protein
LWKNAILALAANVLKDSEDNRQKVSLRAHKERRGTGSRKYHTPPESQALSVRITGEHLSAWKQLCVALPGTSPSVILRNAILVLAASVLKDEKGNRKKD